MPNNIALRNESPVFYRDQGTSCHCVSLTTPGAENTNDKNRGRRLGPRWDRRRLDPEDARPGTVVEIRSPSKVVNDVSTQLHSIEERRNGGRFNGSVALPVPLGAASAHKPPVGVWLDAAATLFASQRSIVQWWLGLGVGALIALIVLAALVWRDQAGQTASATVFKPPMAKASTSVSPASGGLVNGPVQTPEAETKLAQDQPKPVEAPPHTTLLGAHQGKDAEPLTASRPLEPGGNPRRSPGAKQPIPADGNALVDLANGYLRSDGVPQGCAKAMPLLNRAAKGASVRARNRLASMYAVGSCVRRDPVQAYRWMSAALQLDPHNQWAQQNRDLMLRQMTAEERTRVQSAE